MYQTETVPSIREGNRVFIKGLIVGFLIVIMLVPAYFVQSLVTERETRHEEVVNEVSAKWAGRQTVTGPILMLPYNYFVTNSASQNIHHAGMVYVLPDELHVTAALQPSEKKRSLFSVLLYRSQLKLTGRFNMLPLQQMQLSPDAIQWQDARLVINTGDLHGIEDQVQLQWNGSRQNMEAGVPNNQQMKEGLSAPVAISAQTASDFSIDLNLRGSEHLYVTPVGKTTEVNMTAGWKDPSFDGQYLPSTSEVNDKGFTAHWNILPLSHNFPQFWTAGTQDLEKNAFGVRLIQPVDGYAKTNRSVKYAILFIALTFTFFFFLEILQKRQVHPLQYTLVGIALTIFYALLLSISEYTGFNIAYLIASVATISLIGMYAWSMFKNGKTAAGFTASLTTLYTYIFILIQSEDYALLCGSIGLFLIVAIIMYYSRKVDWYGITRHTDTPPPTFSEPLPQ